MNNLLMQFFTVASSKIDLHVFPPIWVLGPGGGGGGRGAPKGLVHNLLMQFFTLGSSKIEVFKIGFCDIVIA